VKSLLRPAFARIWWSAGLLLSASPLALAQDEPLQREVARCLEIAKAQPSGALFRDVALARLRNADQCLQAGWSACALRDLALAMDAMASFAATKPDAGGDTLEALDVEWKRVQQDLFAKPPAALPESLSSERRALAESARSQSREYFDASRDYAIATTFQSGRFYLSLARAHAGFAELVRTLPPKETRPAPAVRALAKDLDDLEQRLVKAYRDKPASEDQTQYTVVSADIKSARELMEAGAPMGALSQYLEAVLAFGLLQVRTPDAAALDALQAAHDSFAERFEDDEIDHGIGRMYFELAECEWARQRARPEAIAARTVQVVLAEVLPRYFAAIDPAREAPAPATPGVVVTMVRWPYT
jgi:hypothetical protein